MFWDWFAIILILLAEIAFVGACVYYSLQKKMLNVVVLMIWAYIINFSLYFVALLYDINNGGGPFDMFELLKCFENAVKHFVVETDANESVMKFAKMYPIFIVEFSIGVVLAVAASFYAVLKVFGNKLSNYFKLSKILSSDECDIVLGTNEAALMYAKNNKNVVLLVDDNTDRDYALTLIEEGYVLLRKNFTVEFLNSHYLNEKTCYSIIYPHENEKFLDDINVFMNYKKNETKTKNIHMFVEMDESKTEVVRRTVIEKNGYKDYITTFSRNELLARTFIETHPVTEFIPPEFFDFDTSVKPDYRINMFFLGFGALSKEIYRYSLINNQLVKFEDGQYRVAPIKYHIYDSAVDCGAWNIDGLKGEIAKLEAEKEEYFTLPELPYDTVCMPDSAYLRSSLQEICRCVKDEKSFTYVVIDSGDIYKNIETGNRLVSMLGDNKNCHIFIRCEIPVAENENLITHYGNFDEILTHDVIVNEKLYLMAKKAHEEYTRNHPKKVKKDDPDFENKVKEEADETWKTSDYFNVYSNVHLAVNLRVKLHLLGLDYVDDGKKEGAQLIGEKYGFKGQYTWEAYADRTVRNALLAQEHSRWNAYHMVCEYLPMKISDITEDKTKKSEPPEFINKNKSTKRHACITTFRGVADVSAYLSGLTGGKYKPEAYDYYKNDEMLINGASRILNDVKYSVIEKKNSAEKGKEDVQG